MRVPVIVALSLFIVLTGCANYTPPSGRADLSGITSESMKDSFAATPAAGTPVHIVAVRVQEAGYRSYYVERQGGVIGDGHYSVVATRELEQSGDLERIQKLPGVGGFIPINRMLIPSTLKSDRELREAAARLRADMVLMYTIDTRYRRNNDSVALTVLTVGFAPTRNVTVTTTASALLIDTRTGFVYGALESTEKRELRSNGWESAEAADRARVDAERAAFGAMVAEFEKTWPAVLARVQQRQ
jgi:hypothetical protein